MQTHVSIRHDDYPPRVRELVEDKLQNLTKFYDRTVTIRALLERDHEEDRVELVAHVGGGTVLVSHAHEEGLSSAIEEAIARLKRQIQRHHDKLRQDRHKVRRAMR